jgi:hypothetical protein
MRPQITTKHPPILTTGKVRNHLAENTEPEKVAEKWPNLIFFDKKSRGF